MSKFLSILPLILIFFSCSTIPVENAEENTRSTTEIVVQKTSVYQSLKEFEGLMEGFSRSQTVSARDIDNREWLMGQINFWADRDQLAVQRIYEDLLYRTWSEAEKGDYLDSVIPLLWNQREMMLEDLAYLIDQSLLFRDLPWMVRDFYDERTEFSYWYIIYMGRSVYPFWLENSVLPEMLKLIPQDRITAVTYLWMKNPENLIKMKSEIYNAGYPWSRLIYLIEISEYINREIESHMSPVEIKDLILAGNLI